MKAAIGGRHRLCHITGVSPPPCSTEPTYPEWEERTLCFFSWIIQNIKANLIGNVATYSSAKALWNALKVTYGDRGNVLQIYDLLVKASELIHEEMPLEHYFNMLQGIWQAIDRQHPNPMKCDLDIVVYNKEWQETRLFQFLAGLRYDTVRRDILKEETLPSVKKAYAQVRREAANIGILNQSTIGETHNGSGLSVKTRTTTSEIGEAHAAKGGKRYRSKDTQQGDRAKQSEERNKLRCSHCGMRRHTKETCFKLVGYPPLVGGQTQENHRIRKIGHRCGEPGSHCRQRGQQLSNQRK